ncbi:MAG: hypothetical protein JEZ06_23065 [Anaerolineaceae bacterium]|nr:hypothetical protein [Anaerolineaceae bacterium]
MQTHKQRIENCLSGEKTDRTPIALWRHFPVDDQSPESLAAATINFQNTYDFDLVKVTPASSYCTKDWGLQDQWNGNMEGTRDYNNPFVNKAEDWGKLNKLDPTKGALGMQIKCLNILSKEYSSNTPLLQTIFSPLSQAKNLVGKPNLVRHIRKYPDQVKAALKIIEDSIIDYIQEIKKTGIDGIFYAVQHAQYDLLSEEEFIEFGKASDFRVLEAANDLWINMVHIHGENIMFEQMVDYPVPILNWHDRSTYPTLSEAREKYDGVLCGGLQRWDTMVRGTPEQVKNEALDAIQSTNGRNFILGTGCVMPIISSHGNIMASIEAANGEYIE